MSINPITGFGHPFAESVRAARSASASARGTSAAEAPGRSEPIPSSPPPEVFSAMLTAVQAADRLAASGRVLHFNTGKTTGLSVQLTDLDGTVLGTVPPSTVLSIASGESID